MTSELLTPDELADLTGCKQRAGQKAWLDEHHWHYVTSRVYVRRGKVVSPTK